MVLRQSVGVSTKAFLNSAVALSVMIGFSVSAQAQSVSDEADENLGAATSPELTDGNVIVVTARRVDEDVQDIPISVGVLGSESLEANNIQAFQDLKGSVVGLTTSRTGTAAGGYVTIRGVTPVASPQPASDQGVGFFIDGVSIARSQGAGAPLVDIARVEVLRGPQGTLFGRNSSIGAINFITNTPVDEFTASASASYGNYDEVELKGIVNLPLGENLIARFAFRHHEQDGDVINTNEGTGYIYPEPFGAIPPTESFDQSNSESYLARLRYTGIEGVTVDYKYDRQELELSPGSQQLIGYNPSNALTGLLAGLAPFQAPGAVVQSFDRLAAVNEDHAPLQSVDNDGHMLDIKVDVGDNSQLRSITAYRTTKSNGATDLDGGAWVIPDVLSGPTGGFFSGFPLTNPFNPAGPILPAGPLCVSCSVNNLDQHAWSQELQFTGEAGPLGYTLGAYYFDEHAEFTNTYSVFAYQQQAPATYTPTQGVSVPPLGTPGDYVLGNDGIYDNASYALYGHLDYEFSQLIDVSLGLRHTWDDRRTNDLRAAPLGSGLSTYDDSRFTWDAALNVHPTPDILVFAKYARGYTSGGIDSNITFVPEVSDQVELGFKSEFANGRVRVNGSIYKTWIENRQSTVPNTSSGANCSPVLLAAGFTAGNCPVGLFVFNLPGTSTIQGLELETFFEPIDGLVLTANLGLNDPEFSTGELHRAPKENIAFSAQYAFPEFGNGMFLNARLDGDYRGDYYATGGNIPGQFDTGSVPAPLRNGLTDAAYIAALEQATIAGDYWLVNGRIALSDIPLGGARAELAGYVRNLFDTDAAYFTVNYGASYHASFERPRTYGVSLSLEF
ncbi:TonB-dependent receptor [Erythrobacter litoralis]|nr:TonB-dependent receptor [Erythrobacter litoralis]